MLGLDQQAAHKAPEPPIHRLPRPIFMGQHALAAARSPQIADGVEDLAQVYLGLALALGKLRQDGPDPFPFCVG
jgi:hypothetical protein